MTSRRTPYGIHKTPEQTSIKQTMMEWGYPAAVLIAWMMATAYTLSKII